MTWCNREVLEHKCGHLYLLKGEICLGLRVHFHLNHLKLLLCCSFFLNAIGLGYLYRAMKISCFLDWFDEQKNPRQINQKPIKQHLKQIQNIFPRNEKETYLIYPSFCLTNIFFPSIYDRKGQCLWITIQHVTTLSDKLRDPIHSCLLFNIYVFCQDCQLFCFRQEWISFADYFNTCLTQECIFYNV